MKNSWKVYYNWNSNCSLYIGGWERKQMECGNGNEMKKPKRKNTKLKEWMDSVRFRFIMTLIVVCRVCTLECELFEWVLFINCVRWNAYPFRTLSQTAKTKKTSTNRIERFEFILRSKCWLACGLIFYLLPDKTSKGVSFFAYSLLLCTV